jgi:hypothetical protein
VACFYCSNFDLAWRELFAKVLRRGNARRVPPIPDIDMTAIISPSRWPCTPSGRRPFAPMTTGDSDCFIRRLSRLLPERTAPMTAKARLLSPSAAAVVLAAGASA